MLLNHHRQIQEKRVDLENRINNTCLYCALENVEEMAMVEFDRNILITELSLSNGVNLEIHTEHKRQNPTQTHHQDPLL